MSSPARTADTNGGVLKNEPVLIGHFAIWLVLNLGIVLTSRYHVFTSTQWSAVSVELTPIVTAALLSLSAWLIRRVVRPAWKVAEADAARLGWTLPSPELLTFSPQMVSSPPLAVPTTSAASEVTQSAVEAMPAPALDGLPVD